MLMRTILNISTLHNYDSFRKTGLPLLHQYLGELLNCEVYIEEQPVEEFEKYINICLTDNVKKYAYVKNADEIVLSIKIISEEGIKAILPIYLVGPQIGTINIAYLEQMGSAISIVMTQCYAQNFNGAERMFGDYLQDKVISSCFAKHTFQTDRISFLISFLKKLCLQTFEGKDFSTGFILTNSAHDYARERDHVRGGNLLKLLEKYNVFRNAKPDRRIWYLVDGNSAFYLMDKHFQLNNIYTIQSNLEMGNFWEDYLLNTILWGQDILFRVINRNQISIVNADGIEFLAVENTWKFRDYKVINELVQSNSMLSEEMVNCILFFVMYCARNGESTIIWLPQDASDSGIDTWLTKRMKMVEQPINIMDQRNIELVKRILSSDGVTIIDNKGNIISNGCVVNLNSALVEKKMTGTGEVATRILANNGMAIKVSQDGSVKVWYDSQKKPFVF